MYNKEVYIPVLISEVYRKLDAVMDKIEADTPCDRPKKVFLVIKDGEIDFDYFFINKK